MLLEDRQAFYDHGVLELEEGIRCATYPDDSWFWPVLEEYRDVAGRTLEEAACAWIRSSTLFASESQREEAVATKRWMLAPRSEKGVEQIIDLLIGFFPSNRAFTYLEFGTCFGTTLARLLAAFPLARGIGVEVDPARFDVTRWLIARMDTEWNLRSRVTLWNASISDVPLPPASIDVVFMDTNHVYADDRASIAHLTTCGALAEGFVFLGDDPFHSGTRLARERFIADQGSRYEIETSAARNLWWFVARNPPAPATRAVVNGDPPGRETPPESPCDRSCPGSPRSRSRHRAS